MVARHDAVRAVCDAIYGKFSAKKSDLRPATVPFRERAGQNAFVERHYDFYVCLYGVLVVSGACAGCGAHDHWVEEVLFGDRSLAFI